MSDETTPETTDEGTPVADLKPQSDENQIEAEHEQRGGAIYSSGEEDPRFAFPNDDYEYEIDQEAGTVATKVGTVGWPEGAYNEQGTGPE